MGEAVQFPRNDSNKIRFKTNLSIWVIYSSDVFKIHIQNELGQCRNVNFELIFLADLVAANLSKFSSPDLIFVETGPNWAQKVVELHNYDDNSSEQNHEAALVVFGDESDSAALKMALRIGAADFMSDQAMLDEFLPLLTNIADEKVMNRHFGELFIFLNTKGGSGASTLSVNTAVDIAHRYPGKVLLLDLDLQFGTIDDYLNLIPSYGLSDVIASVADLDEVSLNSLVTKHTSGLHVLSFKHGNSHDNYDKAKDISKLLPLLREIYPFVIIDLSRGVDRLFSSVISPATKIFLVTQQNLAALKNTSRIAKSLVFDFGLSKEQMAILVNRYEKRQSIKLKDVQETIEGIDVQVFPNDFKVAVEGANLGRPFVETKKGSPLSKSVIQFVCSQLPDVEVKQGWFKRIFS